MKLAPSILSADFSRLGESVSQIERGGAHFIHVDVMDGHFVPNISFGAAVMKSLVGKTELPFDVHLMIEDPDKYLEDFVTDQTEYIVVHEEACVHLHRTIQHIKSLGIKAGVAINPATSLTMLDYILEDVDLVLIMSVNPGFGGQKFIEATYDRLSALKEEIKRQAVDCLIQVDGGVSAANSMRLVECGADILVAGSAVFKAEDPASVIAAMR
mgnify:CR=1 FL=1